jgi:exodeoxyribonuclease VII large subunit
MPERPPFDPARVRAPATRSAPEQPATLSPSRVNELIRAALTRHMPSTLNVLGEIGDLSRPGSGHLYFSLKDAQGELRCVMWRSSAARLKYDLEPGMQVIATGGIDVYTPRGTIQLIVRKVEPRGVGALELAFRQLRDKLERDGLFDPARKRSLPPVPRRIALVTSPSGAAIRDILHTLDRRFPALDILLLPVRVQGDGAAAEIAAAIRALAQLGATFGKIDLAIVGRGGGSLEDLWAFNEEVVARAIHDSPIPIVSAVGHEVDISISDLVADLRAPTPTAAAELAVPLLADLLASLDARRARAVRSARQHVDLAAGRFDAATRGDWFARPLDRLRMRSQRIDELLSRIERDLGRSVHGAYEQLGNHDRAILRFGAGAGFARIEQRVQHRLTRAAQLLTERLRSAERGVADRMGRVDRLSDLQRIDRYDERLGQTSARVQRLVARLIRGHGKTLDGRMEMIEACDPKHVLRRGYSVTRDARTKQVIRSVAAIRDGMRIITELPDGPFHATADDPRQPGLFDESRADP